MTWRLQDIGVIGQICVSPIGDRLSAVVGCGTKSGLQLGRCLAAAVRYYRLQ